MVQETRSGKSVALRVVRDEVRCRDSEVRVDEDESREDVGVHSARTK